MTLSRDEVVGEAPRQIRQFEQQTRSLSSSDCGTLTRCAGWTVADVIAHVTGTMTMIAEGRFLEFADPEHVDREVALRRGRTADELADEFASSSKVVIDLLGAFDDSAWAGPAVVDVGGGTFGSAVEAIFYDIVVHAADINEALGRSVEPDRADLRVAISHLADLLSSRGYRPTTLVLDGLEEVPVSGGSAERLEGDPYQFILAATGRTDATAIGLDPALNVYAAS